MKRIHIFFIGAKYTLKLCKIQLALKLLGIGESCFLRLTGWSKSKDGAWARPNKCNGFTFCMTHNAASITFAEIPQRIGGIHRGCNAEKAAVIAKGVLKKSEL